MKELFIHNSNKKALIDDEDEERLSKFRWYLTNTKGNKQGSIGRRYNNGYNKTFYVSLASEIMRKPRELFDHTDVNPFNNQKRNLRECSYSQNNANKPKQSGCVSKYKGVNFHKKNNNWVSSIRINGRSKHLGSFKWEENAAKAYNKAALEVWKEFANLNKNENGEVL